MIDYTTDGPKVVQYGRELQGEYTSQRKWDDEWLDLYLQRHVVHITDPDMGRTPQGQGERNKDLVAVGLGRGSLMVDQDVHALSAMFTYRVNPAGTSPETQAHASKLEKFLDASVIRMEEVAPEPQLPKVRKDIVLSGRGVLVVLPQPEHWAGERFLQKAGEGQEDYDTRYQLELRRHYPIIWRSWPARECYWRWYGDDEYVIVRWSKRKVGELLKKYPVVIEGEGVTGTVELEKKYLAEEIKASNEIEVCEYLDSEWYGMFTKDGDELRRWRHYMGLNPGVLFPGNAVPDNEDIRWMGALHHARHAIKAHDEAISNMLTNLRRDTRATTVVYHDPKVEVGGEARGRPVTVKIRPGGQIDLWITEKVDRLGAAQSNADYGVVIGQLQASIDDTGLRRVFMGQVKSDVTGTATRMAGEFAQIELNDIAQGIRGAARKVGIRIFHAVIALEEAVKDLRQETKPDKVYIRYEDKQRKSEEIAVGPSDVLNYDDLVQARWELRTPSDERAMMDIMRLAIEDLPNVGPLMDVRSARERMGMEDPERVDALVDAQRVRNSPQRIDLLNRLSEQRFRGIISGMRDELTPEETMALQAMGLDEEMLAAILGPEVMPPEMGGGDSMVPSENRMREGEQFAVQEPRV